MKEPSSNLQREYHCPHSHGEEGFLARRAFSYYD
jgi:hypothetical protein